MSIIKCVFYVALALVVTGSASAERPTRIFDAMEISESGAYIVQNDITVDEGPVFLVTAEDVEIDLNGPPDDQ